MKAKQIKEVISDYLKGNDYNKINEIINLETLWKEIVGKPISNNTEIVSIKKRILTIKTSNPIWRNELALQKKDLLDKVNETQPSPTIKEIVFR